MTYHVKPNYSEVSREDLAYFAGLLDGEGYVGLTRYDPKGKLPAIRVALVIAMTDRRPMDWLEGTFGGTVSPGRTPSYGKTVYTWTLRAKDAADLLSIVRDRLLVKQAQADLVIEFAKTLRTKSGPIRLSAEIVAERERLYLESRKLNQKGSVAA